ncbi:hypothetical protein AB0H12_00955 [Actinosynnema sp. NPDC023794]
MYQPIKCGVMSFKTVDTGVGDVATAISPADAGRNAACTAGTWAL